MALYAIRYRSIKCTSWPCKSRFVENFVKRLARMGEGAIMSCHQYRGPLVAVLIIGSIIFVTYTTTSFGNGLTLSSKPTQSFDWSTIKSRYEGLSRSSANRHHGNGSAIDNIRLLCIVLTMEKDLATKAAAVNNTWVRRCDKHFFVLTTDKKRPDFLTLDIPDIRTNLVTKIRRTYEVMYDSHINEFDWILKADDDSYVVVENLKLLLSYYNPREPGYIGYHFNHFIPSGYMSGGAGYVMSNAALRHLVEDGYRKNKCVTQTRTDDSEKSEDVDTGACLSSVGVPILSSLDIEGRETFHPYPLEQHLLGNLPGYMYSWAKNRPVVGEKCCSRYVISFHYMSPSAVYLVDFLLYQTTVYGLDDPLIDANATIFKLGKVN